MLPCRKAAQLVDKRSVMPLGPINRIQLWMHLKACAGCRAFHRQGVLIDRVIASRRSSNMVVDMDTFRIRIIEAIQAKTRG